MNKLNQKDDSSDVCDQQQDEVIGTGDLEQSFMETCEGLKASHKKHSHELQIPNAIQMMFILFSFYQDELTEIGFENNCKVKISLNKIKISSDAEKQDVDNCFVRVAKYLQTISYTQFKHENAYKISCSPYFNKKAEEKGFRLCRFNKKIYCHARMNRKNLQAAMKDLFAGQFIFSVDIKSYKSKERQIYNHLRFFLKTIMKFMSKQFKDREVKVQLDTYQVKVNCIGDNQRNLVAVKNQFKNLFESLVIMIINIQNDGQLDQKVEELKRYVEKKSEYPIYVSKLSKKTITIISKQNVMKKLLQRPKVCELIQLNGKTEIGLFLPRRYNYVERKIMIEEICTKKGYDFTTLGGIYHYFKKMFIHQDQQVDQKELLQLINQILISIKENKDKFQIPQKYVNKKKEHKDIQVNQGEYYSTGEIKIDENLSKILKNDVLIEKLKMSKPAFVKYKVFQGEQIDKLFWYINNQQKKVICKIEDMKEGTEYFLGKAKKMGQQYIYSFESKIKIM